MNREMFKNVVDDIKIQETMKERLYKTCLDVQRTKKTYRKRKLVFIAIVVLLMGTVSVGAAMLVRWNAQVERLLQPTEKQKEALISMGVTKGEEQMSISDHGITMNLLQTIQDQSSIYLFFEVIAPAHVPLIEGKDLGIPSVYFSGMAEEENPWFSIEAGFVQELASNKTPNIGYYKVIIGKNTAFDYQGTTMNVTFENLKEEKGKAQVSTLIEGTWSFAIDMSFGNSTRHYELNKTYVISGYDVKIKSIDISPISIQITYDEASIKAMEAGEGIHLDRLEELRPLKIRGVKQKNGKVITAMKDGERFTGGGIEGFNEKEKEYRTSYRIENRVLDVDLVEAILLGEDFSEIPLR